jgi:hypothetical protein
LLAWLDQEHQSGTNAQEEDLAVFVDPVHLDAYAENLDEDDWRTVTHANGRDFYLDLARKVLSAAGGAYLGAFRSCVPRLSAQ